MKQTDFWTRPGVERETQRILDALDGELLSRLNAIRANLEDDDSVRLWKAEGHHYADGGIRLYRHDFQIDDTTNNDWEHLFSLHADLERLVLELREYDAEERNSVPTLKMSLAFPDGEQHGAIKIDGQEQSIPNLSERILTDFAAWVQRAPTERPLAAKLLSAAAR